MRSKGRPDADDVTLVIVSGSAASLALMKKACGW